TLGCASVVVGSPVVPLGSAITASCTIQSNLCRGLEPGNVRITWMLDNEDPPAKPFNLSCVLNLSDYGLTCQWEQGDNSHLPTSVVLKCAGSRAQAVTCCTPQGNHSRCTVPRRLLQLYRKMEIWVSAANALGTAESEHLCIDPMDVAKLDPPVLQSIQSIPFQTDCIALAWEVAHSNAHMDLQCELRYQAPEDPAWSLVSDAGAAGPGRAPKRQEANGRVLGYRVTLSPRRRGRDSPTICNTTHTQCNFSAPVGTRRDGIEPFQRYNISVYPLYKDAIGVPIHTAAYSKQKAPSYAPKLHLKSIGKSSAELCWEPVPVEMQNGFITSYTVFWANSTAEVSSATVSPSLSSFVIRELKPSTLYKVHIMASTAAGSTNGTSLTLVTMVLDDIEIQFLFLTLGLIFVLLILLLICFQKNGRVKQQFWPSVPDPANSSLSKWVPAELQQ
ncbi:PREDICTED: granulocyte colony-stimulating factor receptor, partial [Phaethon lepturus]|uniref:granulocyte colony-stimulating factor receptor n=1 Tax=Phaethon lepturus TaxID=97097 RepID=UPI000530B225